MALQFLSIESIDLQPVWPDHAWLILLAIFCQAAGWMAITYALPRLPAADTSFAVLLQPVLTIIWGLLLLNENPSIQQSAGIILILGSVIAVTAFGNTEVTTD